MKRRDLKKLALMGLTSGMLLATNAHANVATNLSNDASTILAGAHKCGGKSGCGSRSSAQQGCGARPVAVRDASTTTPSSSTLTPSKQPVQRYPATAPITQERLRDQLSVDTKKIYDALPESGKELALQAVNKEPTRDKNEIVKSIRDKLSQGNGSLKGN